MLPAERYYVILEQAKTQRFVSVEKLQQLTGGSLSTLRRDIARLEKNGKIVRSSGGIILQGVNTFDDNSYPYDEREVTFQVQKERIGKAAQKYIETGDVIFLVEGTTTAQVARHIDPGKRLTIVTNGIDILQNLQDKPNVQVIILGGVVNYHHRCITGPMLIDMFEKFFPTKIISGAGGITEERGLTTYDLVGASFFKKIMEEKVEVIVVADHSKFGRNVLVQVIPVNKITKIVTDSEIERKYIDMFVANNVEYLLA